MDAKVTGIIDAETERLVPLETRLHENARTRSIWRSGRPRLTRERTFVLARAVPWDAAPAGLSDALHRAGFNPYPGAGN
ncbi:MAG: hypothetical protein RL291_996 [Pseudomonadota bacterium]